MSSMYPHPQPGIGMGVTRKLLPAYFLVLAVSGILLAMAPAASAHNPDIVAHVTCGSPGEVVVSFTATSWMSTDATRRVNNSVGIDVVVGGVVTRMTTGAFTAADGYTFGGTFALALTTAPVMVRATALVPFGPHGEYGEQGATRETSVLAMPTCPVPVPTTTTVMPTTTTVVPTTTTSVSTTTTAVSTTTTVVPTTTTSGPVQVLVVVTGPTTVPPTVPVRVEAVTFVVGPAQLPATGSRSAARLIGLAIALVGVGACACAIARRPAWRSRS